MNWESFIQGLIYTHAGLGGIALLTGLISISSKKGGQLHRKSGKVFVISMILSAITAIFVSVQENHQSPFLLAIGIFSLYLTIGGYRATKLKKGQSLLFDKIVALLMIFTGLLMIFYPIIFFGQINIVLLVFAGIGIALAIQDLMLFKNEEKLFEGKIRLHIGKITGAYISAVTAFVVVNQLIPGIYGWLAPTVVGTFFITYWMRKYSTQR